MVQQFLRYGVVCSVGSPVQGSQFGCFRDVFRIGSVFEQTLHNFESFFRGIVLLALGHVAAEAGANEGREIVLVLRIDYHVLHATVVPRNAIADILNDLIVTLARSKM